MHLSTNRSCFPEDWRPWNSGHVSIPHRYEILLIWDVAQKAPISLERQKGKFKIRSRWAKLLSLSEQKCIFRHSHGRFSLRILGSSSRAGTKGWLEILQTHLICISSPPPPPPPPPRTHYSPFDNLFLFNMINWFFFQSYGKCEPKHVEKCLFSLICITQYTSDASAQVPLPDTYLISTTPPSSCKGHKGALNIRSQ